MPRPKLRKKKRTGPSVGYRVICPGASPPGREVDRCPHEADVILVVQDSMSLRTIQAHLLTAGWITLGGLLPGPQKIPVMESVCPRCGLVMVDYLRVQAAEHGVTGEGLKKLREWRTICTDHIE